MASRRIMATAGLMMAGVACAVAAQPPAPPKPGFWLTGLPPNATQGAVICLTQDGKVAGGTNIGITPAIFSAGFTWTQSRGRNDFGLLAGMPAQVPAVDLSDNGIITGFMYNNGSIDTTRAYRWTGTGPLQDLGVLPGETRSYGHGVSGDGTVVVGHAEHGTWTYYTGQAFRWTPAKGMQGLGYAKAGDVLSDARAVSRDGKAIVGISGPIGTDAFVWTEAGGMKILSKLPNQVGYDTHANAVNNDGSVIVGDSPSARGYSHAVRWVDGKVEDLTIGSIFGGSIAYATSDDGNVVGGFAGPAFIWTPSTGMLAAEEYLWMHGVSVPANYLIQYVFAVSGDGLTFGGAAKNLLNNKTEGFVATIPGTSCVADCDATGALDIDDFICFQTRFAVSDPYADCDASGELDIDDFICFQTLFAIGCQG